MSLAAIQWAWTQKLPASQKLVLMAMADHVNKEEGICWPSLQLLADKTGLCTRTIKEARRQLREKELIIALRPGRYQLCHLLEKPAPKGGNTYPAQKNLPCEGNAPRGENAAPSEESLSPLYKNLENNPQINLNPILKNLTVKESHFFQTWQRHEKNNFQELALTRKTNPAEARKAMISLIRNLTPKLIPLILGEEE